VIEIAGGAVISVNGVWGLSFGGKNSGEPTGALQIPPLRYAPVGMTKVGVVHPFGSDMEDGEQQVPPLRYATLRIS
jgi:hypothetical protein